MYVSTLLSCQLSFRGRLRPLLPFFSGFSSSVPVTVCNLPSPVCSGVVAMALSVCSVTYSSATPMVSSALFAPPLNIMPVEPASKQRCEDLLEDRFEMLAIFKVVWATFKCSSQHLSDRPGPSSASLAIALAVSSSAAPACDPSVSAAGAGPLTLSGSPPSSQSATSSHSPAHSRLRSLPIACRSCGPCLVFIGPGPGTCLPVGGLQLLVTFRAASFAHSGSTRSSSECWRASCRRSPLSWR